MNKDSLLKLLSTAKEDTARVLLLINIGNEYELTDPETAGRYYLMAGDLSKRLHYKMGIIKFISNYQNTLYSMRCLRNKKKRYLYKQIL